LITALQPITAGALARPVLGQRVDAGQWLGFGIGLAGVALVVSADLGAGHSTPPWAYALPFLGMAGLVAATLLERGAHLGTPLGDALVIQCTTSAALFGILALTTGHVTPPAHDGNFWVVMAWVVVLSTFGGYGFYWLNLRRTSVTRVSSLIYLTPPTTMVWALLMFGETPRLRAGLGLFVCLVAVLIVYRPDGGTRGVTSSRRATPDGDSPPLATPSPKAG
jgi:drug/metabolite transporter (DMT)-like permease